MPQFENTIDQNAEMQLNNNTTEPFFSVVSYLAIHV